MTMHASVPGSLQVFIMAEATRRVSERSVLFGRSDGRIKADKVEKRSCKDAALRCRQCAVNRFVAVAYFVKHVRYARAVHKSESNAISSTLPAIVNTNLPFNEGGVTVRRLIRV